MSEFLWTAVIGGALAFLTPCVFPMIPLTVSYFTSHGGTNRAQALRNAVIFSLAIIVTFTLLGMVLTLLLGASGVNKFGANPWVNLVIAAIFLGFAFSLLGAFDLALPYSFVNKLDSLTRSKESSGVVGAFLMGLTFTVTSFTCTVPFVGSVLVLAANGNWQQPVIGMLAFSTVFALPFFILALLPQALSHLPKSGGWLNSVKVVMGFVEIAAAMKFISNADLYWNWQIFTYDVIVASWVAVGLITTLYLLGKISFAHDSPVGALSAGRVLAAIIFFGTGIWLSTGLMGKSLGTLDAFLPPRDYGVTGGGGIQAAGPAGPKKVELSWIKNDWDSVLAVAKRENKRIFIDFTGFQ
jgi:thiol:disulfide interchange protein DsbD